MGTADAAYNQQIPTEEIDTGLWGEMESESEEEESEDEDEDEEEGEGEEGGEGGLPSGAQTPVVGEPGMATPSGMSSVGGIGQETPELLELRKKKIEAEMEGGETPNLYTGTVTISFIVNRLPKLCFQDIYGCIQYVLRVKQSKLKSAYFVVVRPSNLKKVFCVHSLIVGN